MNAEPNDRFRRAWDQVREYWQRLKQGEATREQDPQPQLSAEFFAFYRENPLSTEGAKALETAFMMWGNTGGAAAVDQALAFLDVNSDTWARVLHGVGNAYGRSGRSAEYVPLLQTLKRRLTHPRSRSALFDTLGMHLLSADDIEGAASYYRQVVELQADPLEVWRAQGALYEIEALQPGQPAPDFAAVTIDGEAIGLASLRGRVVLLDFWATTCGPCHPEFPHLRAVHGAFPERDFCLIGISQDRSEQALREVITRERLAWPQIREDVTWQDHLPVFGQVSGLYNVWGIPRTILIDRTGRIAAKNLRGGALEDAVRNLVLSSHRNPETHT